LIGELFALAAVKVQKERLQLPYLGHFARTTIKRSQRGVYVPALTIKMFRRTRSGIKISKELLLHHPTLNPDYAVFTLIGKHSTEKVFYVHFNISLYFL
jgi:hypothetical protein